MIEQPISLGTIVPDNFREQFLSAEPSLLSPLTVSVTQEDIDNSIPEGSEESNFIVVSLVRTLEEKGLEASCVQLFDVESDEHALLFLTDEHALTEGQDYKLPAELLEKVRAFDKGQKVEPFCYDIILGAMENLL